VRIAIVSHTSRHAGGVETYLGMIAPELQRRGHAVSCWFEGDEGPSGPLLAPDSGVPAWTCGSDRAEWIEALRTWRPDVLYVHGLGSPELEHEVLSVAPAAFFAHSYYGTCISGTRLHRLPSDAICTREFGVGCLAQYFPRRCGGLSPVTMVRQFNVQRSRRELLHRYRYILVHASHMAAVYEGHGFHNIRSIGYPARPAQVSRTREPHMPWRVLYLGRFEPTKGADLALAGAEIAAEELKVPLHLQMSGAGTQATWLRGEAKRATERSRHLSVAITDWLNPDAVGHTLSACDLLLVPSRWPEPFGLSGIEAGMYGVPSVAFDAGGIRDWLVDGKNGRLVPGPPEARPFGRAIAACLRDSTRLAEMRKAAVDQAQRFTMARHVPRLESVFEEMLAAEHSEAAAR
jgi:glycosyltransferase involved in cell wall biosynthesis